MWLLLVDTVASSWNLRRRALANLVGSPLRSYSASDGKMGADNPGRKKAPPIPLFSFTSCAPLRLGSYSIIWKFPKIKVPPNRPFWSVFMDFPLTSTILGTSVFSNPPYCCIYLFDIIPRLSWETLRAAWMMRTRKTLPSWVNHDPFCYVLLRMSDSRCNSEPCGVGSSDICVERKSWSANGTRNW